MIASREVARRIRPAFARRWVIAWTLARELGRLPTRGEVSRASTATAFDVEGAERLERARLEAGAPIPPENWPGVRRVLDGCSSPKEIVGLFLTGDELDLWAAPLRCPFHEGARRGSFRLFRPAPGEWRWKCLHGGLEHGTTSEDGSTMGDALDLLALFLGCSIGEAAAVALAWLRGPRENAPRRWGCAMSAPAPEVQP